jgi:hypothetical protein
MGEFCTGGIGIPFVPRCFWIWYAENRREALLSNSPPRCSAASASCCCGGGGGGGKLAGQSCCCRDSGDFGIGSSEGYGAMTGSCCAVVLDREESVDSWLALVERFALGFAGRASYLLGEALPGTEDDRGGRSGPSAIKSLSWRGSRVLAARACWGSSTSPTLPTLPCLGLPPFAALFRCRRRCCFFFKPCSRLIMISRMRGRKLSRLAWEASWLSVSSKIPRSSSGTFPRSCVSTPMALNARDAMLNS